MSSNACYNWCFTCWANPPAWLPDHMTYLICGTEICPETQRQHYQCYVHLKKKLRFSRVKNLLALPDAHIELCKGSPESNIAYCNKDGNFFEHGVKPLDKGARSDLNAVVLRLKDGEAFDDLIDDPECAEVIARHMPYFTKLSNTYKNRAGLDSVKLRMELAILRPWQTALAAAITEEPDTRSVLWFHDSIGNTGKSFMCQYLTAKHGAVVFTHGKVSDIAHAYGMERVVVFDLSRTQADKIDSVYMAIENFKNGRFFSPKYDSHTKIFDPPHVVCFSNFAPNQYALSADRWRITSLD